ncbi:hypothetical protein ACFWC9_39600, partial [Streptomyces goshikiensis]|uniref:hypothetical protein n=1 Tax=Streptomyces goshikiensis TaxID=1942 RepID=UPI0036B2B658
NLCRSLALTAGTVLLAGITPAGTAHAADACGQSFVDYGGTFVGTVQLGDGPQVVTYSLSFPTANTFQMVLTVSGNSGSYEFRGNKGVQVTQSTGNLELTIPRWLHQGSVDYVDVVARDTQCELGGSIVPPNPTHFRFNLPGGPDIIMRRT